MKTTLKKNVKAGFSLVEMLVVIAVIGIIAAIAVPTIGSITKQANTNKAKRNAQNLASVFASAVAAGAEATGANDKAICDLLIAGVYGADSFDTTLFKVPNMTDDDRDDAVAYLITDDSALNYSQGVDTATDG
ncbi:MAG: prepilin-type N-terminal cleavage/methylation domain-containing protein [Pseudoalteromonas tetraodonis]|jgi:prepilin-type N-terminal cleavage/methylation domain-containing protein